MTKTVPAEILFHRLPDGRQIAWRQKGQGPPLIMLHGWSMSGTVFDEVASALSDDFQVLCPDLCGHGWSDPGDEFNLERLAADLVDWMKSLALTGSVLLGWSLGGQVAMQLAVREKSLINRLLLISTTPCFCQKEGWHHGLPQTQVRTMNRQLKRAYLKTLGEFFDLQFADEPLTSVRRREILRFSARSSRLPEPNDCIATLSILGTEDIRPLLRDISCPVMVMHGSTDRIIPCAAGRTLADEIVGAQFHLLEGVGHAPFISRPNACVDIWRGFLK